MNKFLLGAIVSIFSVSVVAEESLLKAYEGENFKSVHKDFYVGKGFAKLDSKEKTMLRYEDNQQNFTFVLVEDKVVDAYKIEK